MIIRRSTVEHPFCTIKAWMGATHFQMKTLKHVKTEMVLHILAYIYETGYGDCRHAGAHKGDGGLLFAYCIRHITNDIALGAGKTVL